MHEDLLGYLLGALSAHERRRIEAQLAADPRLQRELEQLRRCLEPLSALRDEVEPPPGLVDRVLNSIETYEDEHRVTPRERVTARTRTRLSLQRYSGLDSIVLALVGIAAFTLLLPALANSRFEACKILCADNLRVVGGELIDYSQLRSDRTFPQVPIFGPRAFAGIFAPILAENELLDTARPHLICPGTELARHADHWSVPTLEEIDQAQGMRLWLLQSQAAGSYAYCVGHVENGRLRAVKNQSREGYALLADAPSFSLADRQSANHAGRGQNIFFEDGHVAFVTDVRLLLADDPFRNREGYAEAGMDLHDAAVLPSVLPPLEAGSLQKMNRPHPARR